MVVRGRGPGGRPDPESMLDQAMQESFAELAQRGSGVDPEDVVRAPARERQPRREERQPARRTERDQSRAAERERDESGRFTQSRSERRSSQDAVDPYEVLVDPDDETADVEVTRRASRPRRASAPVPDDDEDDETEDDEDLEDDEDDRPEPRRRRIADEAEDDEDDLTPEGRYDLEDDDEEDADERPRARTRRRDEDDDEEEERPRSRQKRFSKRAEREIDKRVEKRVGEVLARDKELTEEQARRQKIDAETGQFLVAALGTPERRQQLEDIALNTRLPKDQRDAAATELAAYRRNHSFFEKYKAGALAVLRSEAAAEDRAAMTAMSELRALDPKVVEKGDRAQTLIHAYATGRALGQQEGMREIKRLRKQLENARGSRDERSTRRIGEGRSASIASGSGRRANGRVGRPDPLARGMEKVRGIGAGSSFPAPTEDLLSKIKNGELTFDQMGLGKVRMG